MVGGNIFQHILKQRQGREFVPWREPIERKDKFSKLTNSYRLQKKTVTELKAAYSLLPL